MGSLEACSEGLREKSMLIKPAEWLAQYGISKTPPGKLVISLLA
jgi:hypothetical protein